MVLIGAVVRRLKYFQHGNTVLLDLGYVDHEPMVRLKIGDQVIM